MEKDHWANTYERQICEMKVRNPISVLKEMEEELSLDKREQFKKHVRSVLEHYLNGYQRESTSDLLVFNQIVTDLNNVLSLRYKDQSPVFWNLWNSKGPSTADVLWHFKSKRDSLFVDESDSEDKEYIQSQEDSSESSSCSDHSDHSDNEDESEQEEFVAKAPPVPVKRLKMEKRKGPLNMNVMRDDYVGRYARECKFFNTYCISTGKDGDQIPGRDLWERYVDWYNETYDEKARPHPEFGTFMDHVAIVQKKCEKSLRSPITYYGLKCSYPRPRAPPLSSNEE